MKKVINLPLPDEPPFERLVPFQPVHFIKSAMRGTTSSLASSRI